ncbi:MAG TPA: hypothetical protein VGW74_13125 [Propionibacteriaceae bacterium]|nr:hypothetical protein [Propionibacteriaceae bacterium]
MIEFPGTRGFVQVDVDGRKVGVATRGLKGALRYFRVEVSPEKARDLADALQRAADEAEREPNVLHAVPAAEREALHAAYQAAQAEATFIGGQLSDDRIILAAIKEYNAAKAMQAATTEENR